MEQQRYSFFLVQCLSQSLGQSSWRWNHQVPNFVRVILDDRRNREMRLVQRSRWVFKYAFNA